MEIKTSNSIWWSFIVTGLIAIVYALLALLVPENIIPTVVTISGISLSAIGVICLLFSLRRKKNMLPWGMLLFESLVMIALGVVTIVWSTDIVQFLGFLIGVWTLVIGAFMLFMTLFQQRLVNKGFYLLSSILSIVFGLLIVINPIEFTKLVVRVSAIIALIFGIIMMMFGFNLRKLDKAVAVEIVEEEVEEVKEEENSVQE